MPVTGQEIINRALQLIGQMKPGETPSASDSNSMLVRLNSIIDSASIQEEMATASLQGTISLATVTQTYTPNPRISKIIGASVAIPGSLFGSALQLRFAVTVLDTRQWDALEDKASQSDKITGIYYNRSMSDPLIYVTPIPLNGGGFLYYDAWSAQAQFTTLSTSLTLDPGYEEWLTSELAIRSAPHYWNAVVSESLRAMNADSKNEIRKLNATLWGVMPTQEGALPGEII